MGIGVNAWASVQIRLDHAGARAGRHASLITETLSVTITMPQFFTLVTWLPFLINFEPLVIQLV